MVEKPYRVAVIGCGNISRRHTAALSDCPQTELVAVCDVREDRAKSVAEKFGIPFVTDYHDLLKDPHIDAVHICTPHYLHAPMAIDALNAGKHVFTEKPMAITPEDCERMKAAAAGSGKALGVCFQNRYNPVNAEIHRLVRSGEVGKVLGGRGIVNWNRTPSYYTESGWRGTWATEGGGVLINQSIHTLDLLLWALGEPETVEATCGILSLRDTIEVEDTASVHMTFPGGASALFFASNAWIDNAPVRLEIRCEKALLSATETALTVYYDSGETRDFTDPTPKTEDKSYWGNYHRYIIEDFYNALREGRPFAVNGEEGERTIRTLQRIYRAAGFGPGAKK